MSSINNKLLCLAGLTMTAWASPPEYSNTYISRGTFGFDGTDNINTMSMMGDTAPIFAFGNLGSQYVKMCTITEDGVLAVAQTLTSDAAGSSDFGRSVKLFGSSAKGRELLIGDQNYAYYYTGGDWNSWSVQQTFEPPSDFPTGEFGKYMAVNNDVDSKEFVTSCPLCNVSPLDASLPIGQLYVYDKKGPKDFWTQSAVLEAAQVGAISKCAPPTRVGFSFQLGAGNVDISGANILATTDYTHCAQGGIVLFSKRHGQWSQQQTFWSPLTYYEKFAVELDTIAIAASGASYGTDSDVGAVYVQYPNTPEYGAKPSPGSPTQWSLHQILYPPVIAEGTLFGTDVSIHDNRMFVGSSAESKIFYYERKTVNGYWSLQQTLDGGDLSLQSTHDVSGSTVVGLGQTPVPFKFVANVYENKYEWECLIISLEDQFGDGWDTARLQIQAPGQEPVYYSPNCNAPNPFEFRYCPSFPTLEYQGLHKLSIVDGPKSQFFWEIQWRVYEESTGTWYRGNHATRMDFHFDAVQRQMTRRGIMHDLPSNITCVNCPGKPEEKPKPGPRKLKEGDDGTHTPTISPAPTLGQTIMTGDSWRYLTLTTEGETWFDEQHQGTNYYISDTQGHRLLSTGTSCYTTPQQCYQTIPDGQYVLRISGGLNKFAGQHQWSFCGRIGGANEQLDFVVSNGKCDAIASYTLGTYCSDVLHSTVIVKVELEMFGVSETLSIEQLTDADLQALSVSIATLVGHDLKSSDIKLTAINNQYGHAIFNIAVHADASKFGADPHDLDSMETIVTQLHSLFSNAANSGQLVTALVSTTIPGAQFFQNLQAVQFIQTSLTTIEPHAITSTNAQVTDITEMKSTTTTESTPDYLFYFVVGGYVASLVAVIGLVVYAYQQINSVSQAIQNKEMKSETSTSNTKSNTLKQQQQQPKSVDSTQKSQQMNTIMIADLIQMVKEEDEQLQKTMSSDHFKV